MYRPPNHTQRWRPSAFSGNIFWTETFMVKRFCIKRSRVTSIFFVHCKSNPSKLVVPLTFVTRSHCKFKLVKTSVSLGTPLLYSIWCPMFSKLSNMWKYSVIPIFSVQMFQNYQINHCPFLSKMLSWACWRANIAIGIDGRNDRLCCGVQSSLQHHTPISKTLRKTNQKATARCALIYRSNQRSKVFELIYWLHLLLHNCVLTETAGQWRCWGSPTSQECATKSL